MEQRPIHKTERGRCRVTLSVRERLNRRAPNGESPQCPQGPQCVTPGLVWLKRTKKTDAGRLVEVLKSSLSPWCEKMLKTNPNHSSLHSFAGACMPSGIVNIIKAALAALQTPSPVAGALAMEMGIQAGTSIRGPNSFPPQGASSDSI